MGYLLIVLCRPDGGLFSLARQSFFYLFDFSSAAAIISLHCANCSQRTPNARRWLRYAA
jgi:hypothetical protein